MKFLLQNGFCRCYSRVANTSVIHDPTIPEAIHHQEDFHITPYLCSTSPPTILHLTSQLRPRPLPWGPPGMAQALFRFSLTCFVLRWFIIKSLYFQMEYRSVCYMASGARYKFHSCNWCLPNIFVTEIHGMKIKVMFWHNMLSTMGCCNR